MEYIGYLCGGFSLASDRDESASKLPSAWKAETFSPEELSQYGLYYLPDFVRFCLNPEAGENLSMRRYCLKKDVSVTLPAELARCSSDMTVNIPCLRLYLCPFRIAMFSIQIEMESSRENDITAAVALLRNLSRLKSPGLEQFRQEVLAPLSEAWMNLSAAAAEGASEDYLRLVEDGNKFNVFQIGCTDSTRWQKGDTDTLLFEMATVSPVGSYDAKSIDSPSETYFRKILEENSLSVYNNWKCLSLSDTLTIICADCPQWLVENWKDDYFGLIYIWQLFRRNYLFRLTRRFRYERENAGKLERESVDFERNCSFHRISYNFLPEEFCACTSRGLKIEKEKAELYHMIAQEESNSEKKADNRMNSLLFFMTCLTMASTIYDACCLFLELVPYDTAIGSRVAGFRLVASIMLTIVLAALLVYRSKVRKS